MNSLREALKGYDILRSSGELAKVSDIKLAFTNTRIDGVTDRSSRLIFGNAIDSSEIVTRQFLLMNNADLPLNRQLLCAIATPGVVTFALPDQWLDIIERHGIAIDKKGSRRAWKQFLRKHLYFYILTFVKEVSRLFLQLLRIHDVVEKKAPDAYAYFSLLSEKNLPQSAGAGNSYDIISWYINWKGKHKKIDTVYHGVKNSVTMSSNGVGVKYLEDPVLPFYSKKQIVAYIVWCIRAAIVSTYNFCIGRWWNVLLMGESIRAVKIRLQKPQLLAKEYLFHNSGWIYRPLWTYEAENRGSRIIFYFYSTNCELIRPAGEQERFYFGYQAMNWPVYLVWDRHQAEFVKRVSEGDPDIQVVGPVWFSTNAEQVPDLPANGIAVFDVQPMRDARYRIMGLDREFYVPEICNRFLVDIYEVINEHAAVMVLKRKREIGKMVHPSYRTLLKKIVHFDRFLAVDPDISAISLIEKATAVISMPYTSTAILGKQLGKPSVYYDPLQMLDKDDPAAHGIEIISGIAELRKWMSANTGQM